MSGTSPNSQNFTSQAQAQAQGTWTGNNTLTYTQSMQPPDPRTHHPGYCKILIYVNEFYDSAVNFCKRFSFSFCKSFFSENAKLHF